MKTRKPIASISYNSPAFLKMKLDELYNSRVIEFYVFVKHTGEDDEAGKKDHCHVYMEPAKAISTENLRDVFAEPDLAHPELPPLNCLPWRSSKYGDWQLYALHDRVYLMSKGMERRFSYSLEQCITSDPLELHRQFYLIDRSKMTPWAAIADAQRSGVSWVEYASSGRVPIPQIKNYHEAWTVMQSANPAESPYSLPFDPVKKWSRTALPSGDTVLVSPSGEAFCVGSFNFGDTWRNIQLSPSVAVVVSPFGDVYSAPASSAFDINKI